MNNSNSKCECDSTPVWLDKENNTNISTRWKVPNKTSMTSEHDYKLKEFLKLCDEMESCITELTRESDSHILNDEYFSFKKELIKIKNKTVLEAYESKCFVWNF